MPSGEAIGRAVLAATDGDGDPVAIGEALEHARRAAETRWGVSVDALAFAEYVGERLDGRGIDELHTDDLLLACGCAKGDNRAIRVFEREYMTAVPAMVSRLAPPASVVDEVRQTLRARLLVSTLQRPPAITRYAGRGALAGWLKVVAVRETLTQLRQRGPRPAEEEAALLTTPGHDPEFDLMRQRYGDAFKSAFVAALLALSERDRAVLREHLVERLSIDQIGDLHGVHRATAARWLVSIRDGLYEATRNELRSALDIDAREYESILRLIRSQLHVTVARHLN